MTGQQFDPRKPSFRLAPRLAVVFAGVAALAMGWQLTAGALPMPGEATPIDPVALAALQHEAFARAEAQPGLKPAENVEIKIRSGETFEAAVRRAGITAADAEEVVSLVSQVFDPLHPKAGWAFHAAVASPRDERGPVRLVGLSMETSPASALTISRTFDGALRLRQMQEKVFDERAVACGPIQGSLSASVTRAGAPASQVSRAAKILGAKLDLSRDLHPGDEFCLVFDRTVTESGRTVQAGDLLYVELNGKETKTPLRLYSFRPEGAKQPQFFDAEGKTNNGFLLKTPIDGARVTSNFGMRRHPILGYNRGHQGTDFGAPSGTPVYAAGDGVVVRVGPNGGYGNWVQIRHSGGYETGYAHLSRFAKGLKRGQRVTQGQVIAYVGSTGRSTGPHLHYEVMIRGRKVDPRGAKVPTGTVLAGAEMAAFKARRDQLDTILVAERAQPGSTLAQRRTLVDEPVLLQAKATN